MSLPQPCLAQQHHRPQRQQHRPRRTAPPPPSAFHAPLVLSTAGFNALSLSITPRVPLAKRTAVVVVPLSRCTSLRRWSAHANKGTTSHDAHRTDSLPVSSGPASESRHQQQTQHLLHNQEQQRQRQHQHQEECIETTVMGDVNSDSSLLHLQQQDATVTNTASSIHPVIPPPLLISRADSHAGTTGSTMHVATARALTPMRRPRDDPLSSFNTDGETQAMPSQRRTDLMAPAQTGIWALVPYVALAVVTAGVGWILKKRFVARQERLVEEFGEVMVQYGTTPDARVEIASEYKRKLGPGILRGAMFASFLHCLISEKAIVPATISDVASVKRLLKLSDARVVSAVNRLATQLEVAPSLLGKLLFISSRIIDDPSYTLAPAAPPAAVPEDMQQLKKEKKKSKAVSSSHLDIVPLFPYSAETVADLQRNMLERCYKEYCDDEIELHAVDTPPLEAAAILRLDQRDAETLFDTVVAQRARRKEEELAKLAAEAAERATKQDEVTELDSPARSGEPAKANVHAYQCSDCGYTLFPAAGREFKFYGDDFVCPACGAPKDKFVDLNADD